MTIELMALSSYEFQVRMTIDKFGAAAVQNSWYDTKQVWAMSMSLVYIQR